MKTLISIDPGKSSGVAIGTYSDTEPYKRTHAFQIEGGLLPFLNQVHYIEDAVHTLSICGEKWRTVWDKDWVFISEKFTPRQSLTLASAEPLRIEGALIARRIMPDYIQGKPNPLWNQPIQQYFSGGHDLKSRKKAAYEFLRRHDLYLTGKQVGCKDAHDAMSATLHAISWLRRQHHEPTLRAYWPDEKE